MKFFFLLIVVSFVAPVLAKDVAMITQIEGNAFVFGKKYSGSLRYGSRIADMTEIMVEDDSYLTVEDYNGHTYHLAGGTHVKFFKNIIEVKAGKVWVNSRNTLDYFVMQSVNAIANFKDGQFVFTFDNYGAKSQLMVLQGSVNYTNILQPELSVDVLSGQFSLVDQDYNDGLPRSPTQVGKDSYKKMKFSFAGIEQLQKTEFDSIFSPGKVQPKVARSIASVGSSKEQLMAHPPAAPSANHRGEKGQLYEVSSFKGNVRNPSAVDGPMNYYMKNYAPKKEKLNLRTVKVRVFDGYSMPPEKGTTKSNEVSGESSRAPASIQTSTKLIKDINSTFENSLEKAIKNNQRHPAEVNQLIDDLKSYDQTYQKKY